MFKAIEIANDIHWVGALEWNERYIHGFSMPKGSTNNAYLIMDEKITLIDTCMGGLSKELIERISDVVDPADISYIISNHSEKDHAGAISSLIEVAPNAAIVTSMPKGLAILKKYYGEDREFIPVKSGDVLNIGKRELTFVHTPMVHWPEVMFTYDSFSKVLFSADAFGKFGSLDAEEDWICEARRYYFNIVGKFGAPVQTVLKKAAALDLQIICPLHGPVLKDNLDYYLGKYQIWSSYEPESEGVFIAYASLHGNTACAANKLKEILTEKGCPKVAIADLARDDMAEALEDAFRYGKIVFAASSYNGSVMPFMEDFLHHLKGKNYQKRTVALIENGSWAPSANRAMTELLSQMKDISILDSSVTIRGALKDEDVQVLSDLADALLS